MQLFLTSEKSVENRCRAKVQGKNVYVQTGKCSCYLPCICVYIHTLLIILLLIFRRLRRKFGWRPLDGISDVINLIGDVISLISDVISYQ